MKFKEPENKLQFFSLHPKLMLIACDAAWYCLLNFGLEVTLTSMIRVGDSGVHGDGRGCDFRSWDLTKEQIEKLKKYVNEKYDYGDGKHLTCLPHGDKTHPPISEAGMHIHLQVIRDGKS
jgi:hypothetical protein